MFVLFLAGLAVGSPERPVIGVLTVPLDDGCETMNGHSLASLGWLKEQGAAACFTAFYAQWIEAGGAQVAIIPFDANNETIDTLLAAVDGVLFTGGGLSLKLDTQFDKIASRIFNYAKGHRITLWGTCMGFQLLNVLAAQTRDVLDRYAFDSESISWPLDFTQEVAGSKLFGKAPQTVVKILGSENVTVNLHHDGVTPQTYASNERLASFFDILSTNRDRKGKQFVSTIEAKGHDIYGVQWHPERPQFEWTLHEGLAHSADAIEANSYMARFFINSARKTNPAGNVTKKMMIYNHTLLDPNDDSYMWYLFGAKGQKIEL